MEDSVDGIIMILIRNYQNHSERNGCIRIALISVVTNVLMNLGLMNARLAIRGNSGSMNGSF